MLKINRILWPNIANILYFLLKINGKVKLIGDGF